MQGHITQGSQTKTARLGFDCRDDGPVAPGCCRGPGVGEPAREPPNGPPSPGFDVTRFSNSGNGWFDTFYVKKTEPLGDAFKAGRVADDTRVLVTETKTGRLALLTDQMAFHHIAEGRAGGQDWMATF
ncbi:MAG: hypothetical protein ABJA98_18025 [Acidobacteriota bacterium]